MSILTVNIVDQRPIVRVNLLPSGTVIGGEVTEQAIIDALGYNPATEIDLAQKAIAGIVDFDLTGVAGDTHTVTILPEHSGFTLDIRADLDDDVTVIVGNDITIEQPITIRKTGIFSLELRAANTDIVIEANDVEDDAGVDYVDITGETINTVQIMRKSNNLIWVI